MEELWVQTPEGPNATKDQRFMVFRYGPTIEGTGRVVIPTGIVRILQDATDGGVRTGMAARVTGNMP